MINFIVRVIISAIISAIVYAIIASITYAIATSIRKAINSKVEDSIVNELNELSEAQIEELVDVDVQKIRGYYHVSVKESIFGVFETQYRSKKRRDVVPDLKKQLFRFLVRNREVLANNSKTEYRFFCSMWSNLGIENNEQDVSSEDSILEFETRLNSIMPKLI